MREILEAVGIVVLLCLPAATGLFVLEKVGTSPKYTLEKECIEGFVYLVTETDSFVAKRIEIVNGKYSECILK